MARLEPIPTWALSLDDDRARAAIFDWLQRLNDSVEDSLTLQNDAGCIFEYSSATVCKLNPTRSGTVPVYIGGKLSFVDVPSAGVSFSNSGLSSSTLYYAYVYWTGTALVGEFSAAGHADSNGVETKSDDQTRTLVGMVRTNSSSQFETVNSNKLVLSWYNDKDFYIGRAASGNTNVSSTTPVNLLASKIEFVTWGRRIAGWGQSLVTAGTANSIIFLTLDGSAFGLGGYGPASATNQISTVGGVDVAEGYHYVNLTGQLQSGTSTATHFAAGTGAFIVV